MSEAAPGAVERVCIPRGSRLRIRVVPPPEGRCARGQDTVVEIVGPDGAAVSVGAALRVVAATWQVDARRDVARAAVVFENVELDVEGVHDAAEQQAIHYAHLRRRAEVAEEECQRLKGELARRGGSA